VKYSALPNNTTPVGNSPKLRFLATVYSLEAAKTGFNTKNTRDTMEKIIVLTSLAFFSKI